jgi:hypothetical protein
MKSKKAISDIVSTVLIIMIAVAAVGIIGAIVVPMVRNSLQGGTACLGALSDVSIETQGTCINKTNVSNVTIKVQVRKGSDATVNLDSIIIQVMDTEGSSTPRTIGNLSMSLGQVKVFSIDMVSNKSDSITLAPVVRMGNSLKQCDASTTQTKLVSCN